MGRRLTKEEVVTIEVLARRGVSNREIARRLGVAESSVRYRVKRAGQSEPDGRADKPFKAETCADPIAVWHQAHADDARPVNVRELYEHLVADHRYEGTYRSVVRFVRAKYPKPRRRTYRRVETPPGAQAQTDWGEYPRVDLGDGPEPLHAFVMVLSHSRMPAIVWSRSAKLLGWLHVHNEAFNRLGGIPAVNRIDNLKTAVSKGAGSWGVLHPSYAAYARQVGFHVDLCPPRAGNAKGKVEAKVRLSRLRTNPRRQRFDGLDDLQAWTDARLEGWSKNAICPVTGDTVYDSWRRELERLRPLPWLPAPFDVAVTRTVHGDATVAFEGRRYSVPFHLVGRRVEVHGCSETVEFYADGELVKSWPRGTKARLLVADDDYDGPSTDRVLAPPPLGKMGKELARLAAMPVQQRPLDLYAALAEVAR